MTINYTTLLGLAQPVTGTESGTWGTVVNDEITALVEQAVAGAVSINVTASNVTLSDTDGASNQARNAILLVTGTPGTSRNIVAPSSSKIYIVINGSDSAVVIKGSATTGVTIPVGTRGMVFWNGSDFVLLSNLVTATSGSAILKLPTADGSNGQAIVTNGSGTLSFGNAGISTGKSIAMAMIFGF